MQGYMMGVQSVRQPGALCLVARPVCGGRVQLCRSRDVSPTLKRETPIVSGFCRAGVECSRQVTGRQGRGVSEDCLLLR